MEKNLEIFLKELKKFGESENIPNVSELNGKFLNFLVKTNGAKKILEIGSANGYSTIWLAEAAKKNGGKVTSYEISEPAQEMAKENLKKAKLFDFVEFRFGNPLKEKIEENFDFVFIDCHKKKYLKVFRHLKGNLETGATVIFDDVIKFGEKMQDLFDYLEKNSYEYFVLPVDSDDGILILTKN